jgi:hypothetical protein
MEPQENSSHDEKRLQHELNNHLTVLSVAREVLEDERTTEEQRRETRVQMASAREAARRIEAELGIKRNES